MEVTVKSFKELITEGEIHEVEVHAPSELPGQVKVLMEGIHADKVHLLDAQGDEIEVWDQESGDDEQTNFFQERNPEWRNIPEAYSHVRFIVIEAISIKPDDEFGELEEEYVLVYQVIT